MTRRLASVGAAAVVLAVSTGPLAGAGVASAAGPDDQPLEAAGRAAELVSFVGVLEVQWPEGTAEHSETLLVQGANGSVVVKGASSVLASAEQRLIEHAGGQWSLLAPAPPRSGRPALTAKYTTATRPGPVLTGRQSRIVEVSQGGTLVERVYLDQETNLLLRREQFEDGQPARTVAFQSLSIGSSTPPPSFPTNVVGVAAKTLSLAAGLPQGVSAPAGLAGGYQRVGVWKKSGVVQALYSDGLYDLSVFEQPGRLNHAGLGSVDQVGVGQLTGWHERWPGGHVVLWEAKGMVYTAVSDAPLDQVLTAARSVPTRQTDSSLLRRLRQAARSLVRPFSD